MSTSRLDNLKNKKQKSEKHEKLESPKTQKQTEKSNGRIKTTSGKAEHLLILLTLTFWSVFHTCSFRLRDSSLLALLALTVVVHSLLLLPLTLALPPKPSVFAGRCWARALNYHYATGPL